MVRTGSRIGGNNAAPFKEAESYAYDQQDRLTEVHSPDGSGARYEYDAGGNRRSELVAKGEDGQYKLSRKYLFVEGSNRLHAALDGRAQNKFAAQLFLATGVPALQFESGGELYHFMLDKGDKEHIHTEGQLITLRDAGGKVKGICSFVFFGEYLHALADTYSHADPENDPYHGTQLGLGVGHGWNDSDPDYTFNHYGFPAIVNKLYPEAQPGPDFGIHWKNNEQRTLQAQKSIFKAIIAEAKATKTNSKVFASLTTMLEEFNRIGESEGYTFNFEGKEKGKYRSPHTESDHDSPASINKDFAGKLAVLNKEILSLGGSYAKIDLTSGDWAYDLKKKQQSIVKKCGAQSKLFS